MLRTYVVRIIQVSRMAVWLTVLSFHHTNPSHLWLFFSCNLDFKLFALASSFSFQKSSVTDDINYLVQPIFIMLGTLILG